MSPIQFSPTARKIFALLNNINDLIAMSSDRQGARDVMTALNAYANAKNFSLPQGKIDSFHAIILDSRPTTMSELIRSIAVDVVKEDSRKAKDFK